MRPATPRTRSFWSPRRIHCSSTCPSGGAFPRHRLPARDARAVPRARAARRSAHRPLRAFPRLVQRRRVWAGASCACSWPGTSRTCCCTPRSSHPRPRQGVFRHQSALVPALVADSGDLVAATRASRIATVSSLVSGAIAVGSQRRGCRAGAARRRAALLRRDGAALGSAVARRPPPGRRGRARRVAVTSLPHVRRGDGRARGAIGFLVFLVAFGLERDAEPLGSSAQSPPRASPVASSGHREPRAPTASPAGRTVARHRAPSRPRCVRWPRSAHSRPGEIAAVFAGRAGRQHRPPVLRQRLATRRPRRRPRSRLHAFETVFQLVWVVGALIAVVFQPSLGVGLVALAAGFGVTAALYVARLMTTTTDEQPSRHRSERPATDARDG